MKPVLLRNLEASQLQLSFSQNFHLMVALQSNAPEAQLQFQEIKEWNAWNLANKPASALAQKLEQHPDIVGCLIDHRPDYEAGMFISPGLFVLVQYSPDSYETIQTQDLTTWRWVPLTQIPLRVLGGDATWIEEMSQRTLEDVVADMPRDTDMTYLLFSISKERHFLGFEDPTPFLFGIDQFDIPYVS